MTTAFGYDRSGNRTRIVDPSGRVATYGFDFAGRPVSAAIDGAPLVTSATYQPFGPRSETSFANGTMQRWTHDSRYQPLTNELVRTGSGPMASYRYETDDAGNITAVHDSSTRRSIATLGTTI